MVDRTDLQTLLLGLTDEQMTRAKWLMRRLGAVDIRWLPNARSVVLHFEYRRAFEVLPAEYDNDPHRREQATEFFCRVMGTVVDDVLPSGILKVGG